MPEQGVVNFHLAELPAGDEDCAHCARGPARMRSRLLGNLSHARSGHLRLPQVR
jgi:hypothetical protein